MRVYPIPIKKKRFNFDFSLTIWLIIVTVALSIIFFFLPRDYYALHPLSVLSGKALWTFITSIFAHAGIFHLFVNMFSLFFVGSLVEKLLGRKRYLGFYLIAGIFAGLLFVVSTFIFPNDMNSFAVGASGALFGLIGLLIILTPNLRVYMMFIPIPIKMKYAAPGILLVLWLISVAGDVPIGNTAHLGGLIAGLFYGVYLKTRYRNKVKYISQHFK